MNSVATAWLEAGRAVGAALEKAGLPHRVDGHGRWIEQEGALGPAEAYIGIPLSADDAPVNPIAIYISEQIAQRDLDSAPVQGCDWRIVLCGSGWTREFVASIQAQVQPHFAGDKITVASLEGLLL